MFGPYQGKTKEMSCVLLDVVLRLLMPQQENKVQTAGVHVQEHTSPNVNDVQAVRFWPRIVAPTLRSPKEVKFTE
jgi:hypothetical protein